MTAQRLLLGTVVGGVVLFFVGYLIYGVVFASFFASNMGSATGVARESLDFAALAVGQLAFALGLTLILGWASATTISQGARIGAFVGLLFFLGIDLTLYASTHIQNLAATLVDPLLGALLFGLAGVAIVWVAKSRR